MAGDFLLEHLPDAPEARPGVGAKHPWREDRFRKTFNLIYGYRSRALHGGRPFPAPMCNPPEKVREWKAAAERPTGLSISTQDGHGVAKDVPLYLRVFAHIARGAILNWWSTTTQ